MRDTILYLLEHPWLQKLFAASMLALAYLFSSFIMRRRRKNQDDGASNLDAYTFYSWELDQMARPQSGHGLAENLEPEMSGELVLKKDGTFEAKCPINVYSGQWHVTPRENDLEVDEDVSFADAPPVFKVEKTTAVLGNEVVLREEKCLVRVLKDTRDMRTIHADTQLVLRSAEGKVIGIFKQKPAERYTVFKK